MKLRIHGNSIRLRLNRREVAQFAGTGQIAETVEFGPDQQLRYGLESSPDAARVEARFSGADIMIVLPANAAREWGETERVAVQGDQALGTGKSLAILVEKEFRRLHGATLDPELYPNPLEARTG
jgi:hypothetical protein